MTSEDWKTVLLAVIAAAVTIYGEVLRRKANTSDKKTDLAAGKADIAAGKADTAARVAAETGLAVNGRLEQLLREATELAYARGKAAGIATVSAAVAESPSVNLDARAIAAAVADASKPDATGPPLKERR